MDVKEVTKGVKEVDLDPAQSKETAQESTVAPDSAPATSEKDTPSQPETAVAPATDEAAAQNGMKSYAVSTCTPITHTCEMNR
jgi:hypothetical protein